MLWCARSHFCLLHLTACKKHLIQSKWRNQTECHSTLSSSWLQLYRVLESQLWTSAATLPEAVHTWTAIGRSPGKTLISTAQEAIQVSMITFFTAIWDRMILWSTAWECWLVVPFLWPSKKSTGKSDKCISHVLLNDMSPWQRSRTPARLQPVLHERRYRTSWDIGCHEANDRNEGFWCRRLRRFGALMFSGGFPGRCVGYTAHQLRESTSLAPTIVITSLTCVTDWGVIRGVD